MTKRLLMLVERDGDRLRLASPDVGAFTGVIAKGSVLSPGQEAGRLEQLGRAFVLVVPDEASGVITSSAPERVHHPVSYGDVLYELAPLRAAEGARATRAHAETRAAGLALRSPQSGRFYHRSAPGEPAFVTAGDVVRDGQPVGLIEVMKTFTHVVYRAGSGLPPRARVLRVKAADGGEVRIGDVVLELEPAD